MVPRTLQHQKETPEEDVDSQVFPDREALHEKIGGKGTDEKAKVKYTGEPRVLGSLEVQVLNDPKDGSIGERGLVDLENSQLGDLLPGYRSIDIHSRRRSRRQGRAKSSSRSCAPVSFQRRD